jgi:uncharacterized protein
MPHQCVHCGEIYPDAAQELLKGCSCGSKFFYYIKQERLDQLKNEGNLEIEETLTQLNKADKEQIENDIREITGLTNEPEKPVVLDLESVRVLGPGKFEIDLVNLFSKKRPIIYRLEEGKYIIDLTSSYKGFKDEIKKKIRDPKEYMDAEKTKKENRIKKEIKTNKEEKNNIVVENKQNSEPENIKKENNKNIDKEEKVTD